MKNHKWDGQGSPMICTECGLTEDTDAPCPVRILSLGAGVQSTTLLMMMIEGEIQKADHAIFSDTGWEPSSVYEHLETLVPLMDKAGIEFHKVSVGRIQEDGLASLPWFVTNPDNTGGMVRRQCTQKYKLKPLQQKQRELVGLAPGQRSKHHLATSIIGISWDEATRMKDPFYPWLENEYPLVNRRITRQMCLDWMQQHGYNRPPRSSCLGCPFHSDAEWRYIANNYPDEFRKVVELEERIRANQAELLPSVNGTPYLHRKRVSLRDVDLRSDEEKGIMNLFDQECEGMCGL
jgi:hypothetical protein